MSELLFCPECGGPRGGVRYTSPGHLRLHRIRVHGVRVVKKRKHPMTVNRWISTLSDDDRVAVAVICAIGEAGLRPTLRALYRGEFEVPRE